MSARLRAACAEALLVAVLVGGLEAVLVGRSIVMVAALAIAGWSAAALVVRGGLAGVLRIEPLGAWRAELMGEDRARAAWRGLLVLAAVALFGLIAFVVVARVHVAYRFRDAGPVALLVVAVMVPLALVIVVGALALDRRVAPRMMFDLAGGRGRSALAVAAGLGVVLPIAVVALAIPAIGLGGVACGSILVVGIVVARAARVGVRRAVQFASAVLLVGAIAGSLAMGHAPQARAAAIEQGIASTRVVRLLLSLGDRDGDGYAGRFGGADCDDADPARHPAAIDVSDNGVDENCTGADARSRASQPATGSTGQHPDILLVSIDALRADHLSAWGYPRPTSPTIDQLAAAGTRFSWAVTPSPTTRHALPALLDGRYASLAERADRPAALAEVLRTAGYATGAVLCGDRLVVADALRGFQDVDRSAEAARAASPGLDNAPAVVDAALRWWSKRTAPAFLWVHLYEPHHPYVAPPGSPDFGTSEADRYDAEIAAVDRELGRLFAAVDPAQTVIVLAADHGEELGEHGLRFHARSLYNQVIRVPLIVRAPGSRAGVSEAPVSLVDVMPTVLELAGVAAPAGLSGVSLVPAMGGSTEPRALLLELPPDRQITRDLVGAIAGPWKVVWDREANAWSLFALADAADAHDVADEQPAALAEMQKVLLDLVDRELGSHR